MDIQDTMTSHSVFPKDALTAQSAVGELKQAKRLKEWWVSDCINVGMNQRTASLHHVYEPR